MKMYGITDLIREMRKRGLPGASRYGVLKYEKLGIIPSPRNPLNNWRSYTSQELENILRLIEEAVRPRRRENEEEKGKDK